VRVTRALTLCGAGGIGKTRLALRILSEVADEYPDGTWFIELADLRQPDLVVSRVASAVGVGEEPGRPLLDTLADALRSRRLLIALDNCEHLIDACAQVCQHLLASSPGLHLIATSREPLRVAAETVWQVPPLSVEPARPLAGPEEAYRYEAVRLFADRAAAAVPGFRLSSANVGSVTALCRALEGIPLAIELAAARVRALSVDQICARLTDRFGLLTTGDRAAPARQQTLLAAIAWSHDLLTEREQVLLRRLSVFAGWSLEMAEQVCAGGSIAVADVLDLLAALVDKSLVVLEPEVLGEARYRMLDTIREYAAARLAEAAETADFRRGLRDYTIRISEHNMAVGMARLAAPWSARVDVFRRYDADSSNVWQVLNRCLADEDVEAGLRICTAVRPCWLVRGTFAEGGECLDAFLAIKTADVPASVRGAALVGRAQLTLSSDPAGAESLAEEGLELCRCAGDEFWVAGALNVLAEIALHTGRTSDASSCADEALTIAQRTDDGWNEGYALGTRAAVAGLLGSLNDAQQLGKASINAMRRIDHQWGAARGLLGLGDLARLRGDPGEARRRYLEALEILREVDSRPEIARCLSGLGRVALDLGTADLARQHLTESIKLSHSTGSRIGVARGLESFAALALQESMQERAVQLIAAASALRQAAGLPPLPGARAEKYLTSARGLGKPAIARLWAQGLAMSSDAAVALALDVSGAAVSGVAAAGVAAAGAVAAGAGEEAAGPPPGSLTPREVEIVALIAGGRSNKAIAEELFISPATAARHVANIMTKLGFNSRTQIAAWGASRQLDLARPADPAPDARSSSGALPDGSGALPDGARCDIGHALACSMSHPAPCGSAALHISITGG
jgi:predicted ATPase/DNA-binding CsgD family transcriptional regulator